MFHARKWSLSLEVCCYEQNAFPIAPFAWFSFCFTLITISKWIHLLDQHCNEGVPVRFLRDRQLSDESFRDTLLAGWMARMSLACVPQRCSQHCVPLSQGPIGSSAGVVSTQLQWSGLLGAFFFGWSRSTDYANDDLTLPVMSTYLLHLPYRMWVVCVPKV